MERIALLERQGAELRAALGRVAWQNVQLMKLVHANATNIEMLARFLIKHDDLVEPADELQAPPEALN